MSDENGLSEYVVQRRDSDGQWQDVATEKVPARTKRSTILRNVMKVDSPMAGTYRVLDAESAHEMTVTLKDQPPLLEIG